ncbi:MAG: 3-isopropylmalate dehydratase large subunit [Clostridiales bacterium]|nr:3-isopropylmalate dehydratase large subunit [Clostridiales bacterium]
MGMTLAEKIIASAAGVDSVRPGDIHTVELDLLMSNDGTTHLTIDMYNKLAHPHIADVNKLVWIVDHNCPSDSPKTAASQKKMRDFAKTHGITFYEGKGVCHQLMMENHVRPGQLIFGADSHTCAYGALGAFGTGVGCTDYLYAMVTGHSWVLVPESLKFNLHGRLNPGVTARDLILTIIGQIGANGANYKAMEFGGEGLATLTMSDRIAVCNLCVEAGAKTAVMEADRVALDYLAAHGRTPKAVFHSDPDAVYAETYDIDLGSIVPVVAKPHFVDQVVPATECRGISIDEAFLGSCNNGRMEDLRAGAALLRGRKVADTVRFLVVPASGEIYRQALAEGLLKTFMEAGAIVMNPNCSVCWGSCQGVIGEGETLISTGTRNFKGRAGHPGSFVYLASAETVTASAILGEIATADQLPPVEG